MSLWGSHRRTLKRSGGRWKVEHFRGFDLERVEMSKARVTALVRWILVVFWMGVIFALSATCGSRKPEAVEILDNADWCHHL